ncbi:MAG TPA: hypothetical protein VGP94_02250 [Tepidisphaeraceae bacterium]|nr:hypothetical protein [Tepidisphaeraceae bacterium]
MKLVTSLLALVIMLGILTSALADTPKHLGRVATVNGVLVSLNGRDLIVRVKQANGEPKEITLPTDDNTEVRVDGEAGTVDDLRPEMMVQITSAVKNVPGPARMVRATSKSLSGVVTRLEGRTVMVKTQGKDEREVAVETDSRTQILFAEPGAQKLASSAAGRLEDIKVGMRVKVLPDTGIARKIYVTGAAKKTGK